MNMEIHYFIMLWHDEFPSIIHKAYFAVPQITLSPITIIHFSLLHSSLAGPQRGTAPFTDQLLLNHCSAKNCL